ncbi:MAG TPA: SAM-dependent methyltransferase [Streptosporangiaceae bacterium]
MVSVPGGLPDGARDVAGVRTDIPHPARIYDYWLGGKDNFAVDRETAEHALELVPEMVDYARGNREFLVRAIRFLCAAGVRQFLDLGAGFPTSPNVHEIAQHADPAARVVYVDNDPVVYLHAEALMAKGTGTAVVRADLRDTDDVLRQASGLLDFTAPVAVMFVACLHHLEDHDDPAGVVARYLDAVTSGSYLVLSHCTDEFAYDKMHEGSADFRRRGGIFVPRSKDAILAMFNGRELLDPGLVLVSYWRPDGGQPGPNASRVIAYGAIAAL